MPRRTHSNGARLCVTRLVDGHAHDHLAADVLYGLTRTPKELPPKYFYDERGSELFDAICATEEYYPTRTEQALLERVASDVMARARPTELVELGSGAARKTRILLDHMIAQADEPCYVPVDISAEMLCRSAEELLRAYPTLHVHAVVADYDHDLHRLPAGRRRLIAFLGGTIGNFEHPRAVDFIRAISAGMTPADWLLVGMDLVKSPAILHAAYNDAQGITAEFNRNVLHVINRELDADFEPAVFEHIARYRPEQEHIEMLLRASRGTRVHIGKLGLDIAFAAGECVRTEISRKFTRASADTLLRAAGLALHAWHESDNGYFALALASPVG